MRRDEGSPRHRRDGEERRDKEGDGCRSAQKTRKIHTRTRPARPATQTNGKGRPDRPEQVDQTCSITENRKVAELIENTQAYNDSQACKHTSGDNIDSFQQRTKTKNKTNMDNVYANAYSLSMNRSTTTARESNKNYSTSPTKEKSRHTTQNVTKRKTRMAAAKKQSKLTSAAENKINSKTTMSNARKKHRTQ